MKIIALLLMLLGCALIVVLAFLFFFAFIMSFDAPGSDSDPKAWMMRGLFFLPLLLLIVVLVLAFLAFRSGNYNRSAGIGSVFGLALVAGLIFMMRIQSQNEAYVQELRAQEVEDAKHPTLTFLRPTPNGADTIIVFPSRIVAYRVFNKTFNKIIGGPIGDLNETRDTIQLEKNPEDFLKREEYEEFANSEGKKFTEVFKFK